MPIISGLYKRRPCYPMSVYINFKATYPNRLTASYLRLKGRAACDFDGFSLPDIKYLWGASYRKRSQILSSSTLVNLRRSTGIILHGGGGVARKGGCLRSIGRSRSSGEGPKIGIRRKLNSSHTAAQPLIILAAA